MKPRLCIAAAVISLIAAVPLTVILSNNTHLFGAERTRGNLAALSIKSNQRIEDEKTKLQVESLAKKQQGAIVAEAKIAVETPQPIAVEPTPAPVAVQAPAPVGCAAYRDMIAQYSWNVNIAFAIMQAENTSCTPSSTSPPNYNGTVDRGLFQVNSIHADLVGGDLNKLYDPATNIDAAYQIYRGGGWGAWSTYNSGKYLRFL